MNFIERQGHNQKRNELRPPSKQIVLFLCDSSLIILLTVHTVLHRDPTRHIEDTTRKDTRFGPAAIEPWTTREFGRESSPSLML